MHIDLSANSCLSQVPHASFRCLLMPSSLRDPREAVLAHLRSRVQTYIPSLRGLLHSLSAQSLSLPASAPVDDDSSAGGSGGVALTVRCAVTLFTPMVGKELSVTVEAVRADHLVCHAHCTFMVLVTWAPQMTYALAHALELRGLDVRALRERLAAEATSNCKLESFELLPVERMPVEPLEAEEHQYTHSQSHSTVSLTVRVTETDLSALPVPHIAALLETLSSLNDSL